MSTSSEETGLSSLSTGSDENNQPTNYLEKFRSILHGSIAILGSIRFQKSWLTTARLWLGTGVLTTVYNVIPGIRLWQRNNVAENAQNKRERLGGEIQELLTQTRTKVESLSNPTAKQTFTQLTTRLVAAARHVDALNVENNLDQHGVRSEVVVLTLSTSLFFAAAGLLQSTIADMKCDKTPSIRLIMKYIGAAAMQITSLGLWWVAGNWYNHNQGILNNYVKQNRRLTRLVERLAVLDRQVDAHLNNNTIVDVNSATDIEQFGRDMAELAQDIFVMRHYWC